MPLNEYDDLLAQESKQDERNEYDLTVHAEDFVAAAQEAQEFVQAKRNPRGFLRLVQVVRKDQ